MEEQRVELNVRLAIRVEGEAVNAYIAGPASMEGSWLIGSIARRISEHGDFFQRWKTLMVDCLAFAIEDITGQVPEMHERPGPEHERSGKA